MTYFNKYPPLNPRPKRAGKMDEREGVTALPLLDFLLIHHDVFVFL
jgi:hypothetical protein